MASSSKPKCCIGILANSNFIMVSSIAPQGYTNASTNPVLIMASSVKSIGCTDAPANSEFISPLFPLLNISIPLTFHFIESITFTYYLLLYLTHSV